MTNGVNICEIHGSINLFLVYSFNVSFHSNLIFNLNLILHVNWQKFWVFGSRSNIYSRMINGNSLNQARIKNA